MLVVWPAEPHHHHRQGWARAGPGMRPGLPAPNAEATHAATLVDRDTWGGSRGNAWFWPLFVVCQRSGVRFPRVFTPCQFAQKGKGTWLC